MANYAASVLLDAIANMNESLNSAELRPPVDQAIEAFMTLREVSIPNLTELKVAEIRATKVNYLNRTTQVVGSTRTCSPTAVYGDSSQSTLSWDTYSVTVHKKYKPMNNNFYSRDVVFENDIYNALLDMRAAVTTDMIAYLEANRTGVNDGTLGTFDAVADVMEYAAADYANFFNYMKTDMFENDYNQQLLNIHNIPQIGLMKFPFAGIDGDGNTETQYMQRIGQWGYEGFEFYPIHLTNASDAQATNYNVYKGGIAVLDWIPPLNREGRDIGTDIWQTANVDSRIIPWELAVKITRGCADSTNYGGATQDLVDIYEFSVDLSLTHAPLTAGGGETVIFKNALLA